MNNRFLDKLSARLSEGRAPLCVGLDPDLTNKPDRYPGLLAWNLDIIAATTDLAACYKPNIAFYEALGRDGFDLLTQTLAAIPADVPIILDAKRGDIGSTAKAYARACFEHWDVDAVTVNPYLGGDGVRPFTAYRDRYVFVLCHTSNPGAGEVQHASQWGLPLYQRIAARAPTWGDGNAGLVVGATYPEALSDVRALAPDAWILAPGVGAQGGDAAAVLAHGANAEDGGVLINVSRGIAGADDPHAAAKALSEIMRLDPAARAQPGLPARTRALALRLHELGCIRFGQFTLASGIQSPVYVDLRRLIDDPSVLGQAAQVYAGFLAGIVAERIAGVPYAALPIATAVSLETGLPMIYTRKESKAHGLARQIEGDYQPGEQVVVIEDLATSAGSLIGNIRAFREAGLIIEDAVVLLDREQGGPQNLAEIGVRLHAAFTFSRLLDILHSAGRISGEEYAIVRDYIAG
ncbi:MAG: orotidine-5'-phosphate decarboxylase [Caldilineales bacterium]|nr:orotidine-5'-phosphate decarboxylase [Caldilineales bacterium]